MQLKSKLKDAELSRAEAQEVLESAGKLDAKAVSASTLRTKNLIANIDALKEGNRGLGRGCGWKQFLFKTSAGSVIYQPAMS